MSATIENYAPPAERAEEMRQRNTYTPTVDITENSDGLVLLLDVPGVAPDGVDVNFERGRLTVYASAKPRDIGDKTEFLLHEYGVGDFRRVFEVGDGVDADKITASLADGVLTIRLPKSAELLPKKIAVQAAR